MQSCSACKRHTAVLIVRHHSNYSRFMSSGYSISTCLPPASIHHVLFSAPAGHLHCVLAGWPRFALLLHLSILFCSLQQQAIIKTTKMKPPECCRPCNDGGLGQCIYANIIILVASDSLYHSTISLFFTPHCIFGVCVSKISCCVPSVFPWSMQCNVA